MLERSSITIMALGCFLLNLSGCDWFGSSGKTKDLSFPINGNKVLITTTVKSNGVQWERTVRELSVPRRHLEVEETFINDSDEVKGVNVNHAVEHGLGETWLGGQKFLALKDLNPKKSPVDFSDPWNPTMYTKIANDGSGVGLVANDDIFRQQARLFYDPIRQKSGLKTEVLCLGPKSSQKMSWSVYETHGEYWDFINALRADWGVNYPIDGSFIWFQPDDILSMNPIFLRERLRYQGVRTVNMFGGWVDPRKKPAKGQMPFIGFGTAVLAPQFAEFRSRIRIAINKIKLAAPEIKVLLYFDAQRDSSVNADDIYKDSLFQGQDLKSESTNWSGAYSKTWSVYPTLQNSFGLKMADVVKMVRELGGDGVYWDEMESLDYSGVRFTMNAWDGHSCLLDTKNKVIRKIGFTNLLSEEAKLSYAKAAGLVFGNSPPTTHAFSKRPDLHMVEGQHLTDYSSYAHLTTPLAYIGTSLKWEDVIAPIGNGLLPASVRLDYATPFFVKLYPITPLKIYPGVVLGQNKIVSSRNGTFGWESDCHEIKISEFNGKGELLNASLAVPILKKPCVVQTKLEKNGVVIIERVPTIEEQPQKSPAFFYQVDR